MSTASIRQARLRRCLLRLAGIGGLFRQLTRLRQPPSRWRPASPLPAGVALTLLRPARRPAARRPAVRRPAVLGAGLPGQDLASPDAAGQSAPPDGPGGGRPVRGDVLRHWWRRLRSAAATASRQLGRLWQRALGRLWQRALARLGALRSVLAPPVLAPPVSAAPGLMLLPWRTPRLVLPRLVLPRLIRQRADARHERDVPWPVVAGAAVGWLSFGVVLYSCYLSLSRSVPVNSDAAANVLQAWAMLHGDPLLRGWVLSDVSFYTTELPQYMLIELARGLSPDVTHIAAAVSYALLVALAARLAKGSARGTLGLVRAGLAAGIMLAPPQSSVSVLLSQPDHVGTGVPVLLVLLLIDRAGRRWFVPPLVLLMVAWALMADQVILIALGGPLAFVGLARAYHLVVRRRERIRTAWFELALTVAAAGGVFTGERLLRLIHSAGGFTVYPVSNQLAPFTDLPHDGAEVAQGAFVLFGADFPGRTVGWLAAVGLAHLVGIGLVCWALIAAFRRFGRAAITVQILAVAVSFSVVAYWLGPNSAPGGTSREFAAVLPLGAALAGRILGRRLRRSRMVPALTAVLALYSAGLVTYATRPAVPAQNQPLADWLVAHHLSYGLGDYWLANSVTVDSGGRVAVRAIRSSSQLAWADMWESKPGWYSAAQHVANFVVMPSYGPGPGIHAPSTATVVHAFGQPARVYLLPGYTVLVWNSNLLTRLVCAFAGPHRSVDTLCSRLVAVG